MNQANKPMNINVTWSPEDSEFVARSDAYPSLSGLAKTRADALRELATAIDLALDVRAKLDSTEPKWRRELAAIHATQFPIGDALPLDGLLDCDGRDFIEADRDSKTGKVCRTRFRWNELTECEMHLVSELWPLEKLRRDVLIKNGSIDLLISVANQLRVHNGHYVRLGQLWHHDSQYMTDKWLLAGIDNTGNAILNERRNASANV